MSRIDDLIRDLCPDGVKFRTLEEIFETRNGYTPSKNDVKAWAGNDIPWFRMDDIRSHGRILRDATQRISKSAVKGGRTFPADSILVATSATIGEHALVRVPHLSNQRFTNLALKDNFKGSFDAKFLFYYCFKLDEWCLKNTTTSSFSSVDMKGFKNFKFPIPPLEVQNEITRTLDQFTQLEAELEAELEARRQQYTYYRKLLIKNASQDAPLVRLRDLGAWHGGITPPKKRSDFWDSPDIHWLTPKDMSTEAVVSTVDHVSSKALTKTSLKYLPKNCIAFVFRSNILRRKLPIAIVHPRVTLNQDMRALVARKDISANYVAEVCLAQQNFLRSHFVRTDGSMAAVDSKALFNHKIPVPPLKKQEQVSNQLAAFRTIATDLTSGLPAEIEARRKQYEYYRDRLLTFPEKN